MNQSKITIWRNWCQLKDFIFLQFSQIGWNYLFFLSLDLLWENHQNECLMICFWKVRHPKKLISIIEFCDCVKKKMNLYWLIIISKSQQLKDNFEMSIEEKFEKAVNTILSRLNQTNSPKTTGNEHFQRNLFISFWTFFFFHISFHLFIIALPWSWVAVTLCDLLTEYPSGLTETIILSETQKRWEESSLLQDLSELSKHSRFFIYFILLFY